MKSSPAFGLRAERARREFLHDALAGLQSSPKQLSSKYFYDKRGSELFDEICLLDEYYLTRRELAIMERHAEEMGQQIGSRVMLVEYGSGSSVKTRYLLDGLPDPVAYVPVDISDQHLHETAEELARDYPHIEILPVCADFTNDFALPLSERTSSHAAVYFPGSTIGNFQPEHAMNLLKQITQLCGTGGGLLIGIDLQKDVRVIEAAYNDARGVTAAFNLNLLKRINRELGGDFDLAQFEHQSIYNAERGRIETSLVSQQTQSVTVAGEVIEFAEGEEIHTECSQKYTVDGFARIAAEAGLTLRRQWTDEDGYYAVLHLAIGS